MADHKHGEMETTDHERTFDAFITFTVRAVVVILVALVLLALIGG